MKLRLHASWTQKGYAIILIVKINSHYDNKNVNHIQASIKVSCYQEVVLECEVVLRMAIGQIWVGSTLLQIQIYNKNQDPYLLQIRHESIFFAQYSDP